MFAHGWFFHFLAGFFLECLAIGILLIRPQGRRRFLAASMFLGIIAIAIGWEFWQLLTGSGEFEVSDIIATILPEFLTLFLSIGLAYFAASAASLSKGKGKGW